MAEAYRDDEILIKSNVRALLNATKKNAPVASKPKTDAQKDAELGVSRTDSAAFADEQAKMRAQEALPKAPTADQLAARKAQEEAATALATAKANAAALAEKLGAKVDPKTGKIDKTTINPQAAQTWYASQPKVKVVTPNPIITPNPIVTPDGTDNTLVNGGQTTNVDVLKSLLRGMGFTTSLIDSSADFLNRLLKDGLDYDNAISIFLDSKEYTFKNGQKTTSPFYNSYGYLNDGLAVPKSASELFSAVEGYKGVVAKYALSDKYISSDSLKKYVKNNVSVSELDERANAARLKAINADPSYTSALKALGYIKSDTDLTDFFLNPDIGKEVLEQNRATAAFSAEAIRRSQLGVVLDAERFKKVSAGLLGRGLDEEEISVLASKGFENIGTNLRTTQKLSGIYEGLTQEQAVSQIQQELESEEFLGIASQRRKRLEELETRAYQGAAGTTTSSLRTRTAGAI
jgi:hypothetical protein